jgi:hypothetical protein
MDALSHLRGIGSVAVVVHEHGVVGTGAAGGIQGGLPRPGKGEPEDCEECK